MPSSTLIRALPSFLAKRAHGHGNNAYTEAELAEMLVDPYEETPKYILAVIYFICAGIILFGLSNLFTLFRRTRAGAALARTKASRRATALSRYIATSQPRPIGFIHFPTKGVIALIAAFWLFVGIWTFAQQSYYRSRWNVGSPPLAMRTGMFALGCFPFILAFGAKWNLVTFVTGYSHEKLQVFHQWISHLFLILSLLHTFPFIMAGREIRSNADGLNPNGYGQLYYSWHVSHKVYYWSGVAALVPLLWLCWGSFAPLRNRFYELFKILHIISAILFSAFFYIHCNALLTSWHYIWATAAIYFTSVVMRFGLIFVRNGRAIPRAHVEPLADNAMRVTVHCPPGHRWSAGQHYFLNFVRASPFESHPYTIANAPYLHPNADAPARVMTVVLRVSPSTGLGPRLLKLASTGTNSTPVLLDGPYGGLQNADLAVHQSVVLLAGGAGASFATSILEDLVERMRREEPGFETKKITVHWAIRNEDSKTWFEDQVREVIALAPSGSVEFHLYLTGSDAEHLPSQSTTAAVDGGEEKGKADSVSSGCSNCKSKQAPWTIHRTRPSLSSLLASHFESVPNGSSVGIGSCGPVEFTTEVRNAVAARQKLIAFGRTGGVGAEEVELHTEEFAW